MPLPTPEPAALREAFLWSAHRTVTKTATVSLHGNIYQVDPVLVGRKVELVFDPFDLDRHRGPPPATAARPAVAFRIGRHAHPKARPEHARSRRRPHRDRLPAPDRRRPHRHQLGDRVNYAALARAPTTTTRQPTRRPEGRSPT